MMKLGSDGDGDLGGVDDDNESHIKITNMQLDHEGYHLVGTTSCREYRNLT